MREHILIKSAQDFLTSIGYQRIASDFNCDYSSIKEKLTVDSAYDVQSSCANEIVFIAKVDDASDLIKEEWVFSHKRIEALERSLESLIQEKASPAWMFVTCYYLTLFKALNICLAAGKYQVYLDVDNFKRMKIKSIADGFPHFEGKNASLSVRMTGPHAGVNWAEIKLTDTKERGLHSKTWTMLRDILKNGVDRRILGPRPMIGDDLNLYNRMKKVLDGDNPANTFLPSSVRNYWNYQNPVCFSHPQFVLNRDASMAVRAIKSPDYCFSVIEKRRTCVQLDEVVHLSFIYHTVNTSYSGIKQLFPV